MPLIVTQIEGLRTDIESVRSSDNPGGNQSQQKNLYSLQEIYRKVQEHDR